MPSMRRAAAFCFSVTALLALTGLSSTALAKPLLPPDPPVIDSPDVSVSLNAHSDAVTMPRASDAPATAQRSPRRLLADFAMKLRTIAYVRGGRELATGFDCSGFVRYVFQQSLGLALPTNSTSQYEAGNHVDRD